MHLSLTSLAVLADYGGPPLQGGCVARSIPIVQDAFEGPLLALHDLRTLTLILPDYVDVDCSSEDLLAMSEAWRDLEALRFELWEYFVPMGMAPPGGDRPRGGPLGAVVRFARNCPRLRTQHLHPMDVTQLEIGEELSPSGPPSHGLRRLFVSKLKIGAQGDSTQSINSVTEFIANVFPRGRVGPQGGARCSC